MPCAVTEFAQSGQLRVIASHQTIQLKPAELHGKQKLQQGSEEKGRKRDACQGDDRDDIVALAVLFRSCNDSERHGDRKFQDKGDCPHGEGDPDRIPEFLYHRDRPFPAVAEIAPQRFACPGDKTGNDPLVHPISCGELLHPFIKALGTGRHGFLSCHCLKVRGRQAAHQHIDNERHHDQYEYRQQQTFENELSHCYVPSFFRCSVHFTRTARPETASVRAVLSYYS